MRDYFGQIASSLLDDRGELDVSAIDQWILDATDHLRRGLLWLKQDPTAKDRLKAFRTPLAHSWAESLVRTREGQIISDREVREAVLVALFTPLRQDVGSCFATAPAIRIQREQPGQMFSDLAELLSTGKLKRIFDGVEYAVPMSPSIGENGNPLLRMWEYTLASFSEVKMECSRWNFYSSLGLKHTEPGGIGEVIYRYLEEKIGEAQTLAHELHGEYETAFYQVNSVELQMSRSINPDEIRRLRAEHQSRLYHMRICLEMRDQHQLQATRYSQLYSWLIAQYDRCFPEYFQEIYDVEMHHLLQDRFEDSPAGFRLVYKHGRHDPALWTIIRNADEYIQALVSFFRAIESRLAVDCGWEGGDVVIGAITIAILNHVQTPRFLELAMQRINRLSNEKKVPWAYISGGTLSTLLKTYCCRSADFTEESRWVESPSELLIFLIDVMKLQSHVWTKAYEQDPDKGLLMTSPSHAFLLQPGLPLFSAAWHDEGFTYTWVRDQIIDPAIEWIRSISLSKEQQAFLSDRWQQGKVFDTPCSPAQWKESALQGNRHPKMIEQIDAFLYESLPLIPAREVMERLKQFWGNDWDLQIAERLLSKADTWLTSLEFQSIAKHCCAKSTAQGVADRARTLKWAHPTPLLFADTNWDTFYFGFLVNPATEQLELWRLNRTATRGFPMNGWKHWINGQDKKPWSVYVRPSEYTYEAQDPWGRLR